MLVVYNDGYYEMVKWVKLFKLIENRIGIVNQLCGCGPGRRASCRLAYERGCYSVVFRGSVVACFRVYDLPSAQSCFEVVDGLADSFWPVKFM